MRGATEENIHATFDFPKGVILNYEEMLIYSFLSKTSAVKDHKFLQVFF